METEEYQNKMRKLKEDFDIQETKLAREYSLSKNTIKVGDIIEDHIGHIMVEVVQFTKHSTLLSTLPQCVYSGAALTKQLKQRKNGEQYRTIYQTNLKK